jgi:hypothetical protein
MEETREKRRVAIWESIGSYISLVLLRRRRQNSIEGGR